MQADKRTALDKQVTLAVAKRKRTLLITGHVMALTLSSILCLLCTSPPSSPLRSIY